MTPLPNPEPDPRQIQLLQQLLLRTLPWLLRQQLPTGEFVAFRKLESGVFPVACPLLSALALDALDCLDPTSDHFHERLFDLIPPPSRLASRLAVDTVRWRLRLHLAAAQSSSGLWRRFGPVGNSPFDLATSAFSFVTYLAHTRRPRQDCAAILATGHPTSLAGQILTHRVLHRVAGASAAPPASLLAQLTPQDLFPIWLLAQAHFEGSLTLTQPQLDLLETLSATPRPAPPTRLETAFLLTLQTTCAYPSPALVESLLLDSTPPWRWPNEPLRGYASSAPAVLAVVLRSLSQAILYPRQLEPTSC